MCVIIVKEKGQNLPTKSLLKQAASVNADGCGFATSSGVYFRSTDFNEFWQMLRKHARKADDIVIHFRWATHGSVQESNCHPFEGEVQRADGTNKKIWFAHNGVLPIDSENNMTDSEIALREYILPVLNHTGGEFTQSVDNLINIISGGRSRFAFVSESGLHLVGHFIEYHGLKLSNDRFLVQNRFYSQFGSRYAGVGL